MVLTQQTMPKIQKLSGSLQVETTFVLMIDKRFRNIFSALLLATLMLILPAAAPLKYGLDWCALKDGDIIFQSSDYGQSKAIQLATHSKYSHCGIIIRRGDGVFVLEAVQPVGYKPIEDWIRQGTGQHFVVKRLNNAGAVLNSAVISKMKQTGESFLGIDYDLTFEWSDKKIYCSELVWKIYKRGAGIEVGKLQKLKEFDLSHPIVKQKLQERYGNKIPLDEPVIAPAAIFNCPDLLTILDR